MWGWETGRWDLYSRGSLSHCQRHPTSDVENCNPGPRYEWGGGGGGDHIHESFVTPIPPRKNHHKPRGATQRAPFTKS